MQVCSVMPYIALCKLGMNVLCHHPNNDMIVDSPRNIITDISACETLC